MQNILVVDDDDSLRDTIGLMLEQEGIHATLVEDGLKGYNEALRLRPDLILADLRMPGMTGVDLAHEARALRPGLRVLLITGYATVADREGGRAAAARQAVPPGASGRGGRRSAAGAVRSRLLRTAVIALERRRSL